MSHGASSASEQASALEQRSLRRAREGRHRLAQSPNEFSLATGAGSPLISNTSRHLFGSWDWENKPALPSPHHPQVLEDSCTSHSASQPVWA